MSKTTPALNGTPPVTQDTDEVMRKDAERYRWLRDIGQDTVDVFFATENNASGWGCWDSWDDKDYAIDAAMLRTPKDATT